MTVTVTLSSLGDRFPTLQWVPKLAGSTEPLASYVHSLCLHEMVEFNFYLRRGEQRLLKEDYTVIKLKTQELFISII